MCAAPFIGWHFNRVCTSYYASETAQHVDAAEDLDGAFDGGCDAVFVAHVDGFGYDAAVRELGVESFDGFECRIRIDVPEGEARGAVFEEGFGGFEGESAGSSCNCTL